MQASSDKKVFLSANWQYLVMFNYEIDPAILKKHLPRFTEVDFFEGKAFISVVGFLFNDTKVFGLRWPLHTNFEEVNLRYYLKHHDGNTWKRGVGFVSEIVPKPIIAHTANMLYNEHYSTAKMRHQIIETDQQISVRYEWQQRKEYRHVLAVEANNVLQDITVGSAEEFIFEHYFGYNQLNKNTTIEYAVEHPRWQVYPVTSFHLDCDVAQLYGAEFVPFIKPMPHSVFFGKRLGSDC